MPKSQLLKGASPRYSRIFSRTRTRTSWTSPSASCRRADHAIDVAKERLAPRLDQRTECRAVTLPRAFDKLRFLFRAESAAANQLTFIYLERCFLLPGREPRQSTPVKKNNRNQKLPRPRWISATVSPPRERLLRLDQDRQSWRRLPEGSRKMASLTMPGISSVLPSNWTPLDSRRLRSRSISSTRRTIVAPCSLGVCCPFEMPMAASPSAPTEFCPAIHFKGFLEAEGVGIELFRLIEIVDAKPRNGKFHRYAPEWIDFVLLVIKSFEREGFPPTGRYERRWDADVADYR